MGVVNNGESGWSEITLSDTLTLGGQAPQIEMSAVSVAGLSQWQRRGTVLHGSVNTELYSRVTR